VEPRDKSAVDECASLEEEVAKAVGINGAIPTDATIFAARQMKVNWRVRQTVFVSHQPFVEFTDCEGFRAEGAEYEH
jgi:hypothetical protein